MTPLRDKAIAAIRDGLGVVSHTNRDAVDAILASGLRLVDPADEARIERAARAVHDLLPAISQEEAWQDVAEMFARAALAAADQEEKP